jgi:hypothetical protein
MITGIRWAVMPIGELHRVFVEDGVWSCSLRSDLKSIPYGDLSAACEYAKCHIR